MKFFSWRFTSSLLLFLAGTCPALLRAQTDTSLEFFEKKIRPLLAENCHACHNAELKTAGLDLSTAEGFFAGGPSGPLVSREDPSSSLLLKVVSYEERLKMPPMGKLSGEQIAGLEQWVGMGAPWPGAEWPELRSKKKAGKEAGSAGVFSEAERNYWAFQPVRDPAPPEVRNEAWVSNAVDRFILARLEEEGLEPAPPADKLMLLRRATFDLTGLPPTEQEMEDFLADDSPDAFAKVVERLLASPRYGERWGRHWLDIARYADSAGNDEDHRYPYAWRYRDYVIRAFNEDLPYGQFVREQIAGDLLPPADGREINRRGIVATGFLALGPKAVAQQDKKKMLYDVYDEQINVLSKTFLGLTVACARCHDHKFDPILQKDYYALAGIFARTRNFEDAQSHVSKLLFRPLVPEEEYGRYLAHREKLLETQFAMEGVIAAEESRYAEALVPSLAGYMRGARDVLDEGAAVEETAAALRLKPRILARWVEFLRPREQQREYLREWFEAEPGEAIHAAREYQCRYEQRLAEWNRRLDQWRETRRRMLKEMNMPPPPKPEFDREKDLFFHDVAFDGGPFALSEEDYERVFRPESLESLKRLRAELKTLEETAPPEPDMACAVEEDEPVEQALFIRGDHNNPGETVQRGFPRILAGENHIDTGQSGRLELANWIARPDNPLTARVMVNRIWLWHFGEGIVRTPHNFGKLGDEPAHPELLDFLARRFVESGWSVKQMHRLIMLSSAYRMSSRSTEEKTGKDPANRLLSHFNRRRLEVEEIRDGLLAIDGSLDLEMGGTLQSGFGTDRENSNARLSMDPAKVDRRLVYLPLRRSNLPALLNLFDFGDATISLGKRPVTNVAPQALFVMNSEFVAERAGNLAAQLLADEALSEAERADRAYLLTLNRKPAPAEVDHALTYMARLREKFDGVSEHEAWTSFCRILMASNEFIYVD